MAEALAVVGSVASVIQLVDFTGKVFERVNHYIRCVNEAPESLREIAIHLPLFIEALHRVQFHIDFGHFNPQTSSALKLMIDECYSQMIVLDNLMIKLAPEQSESRLARTRKAILSLKDEKSLERMFTKISGYIKMLLLYQTSVTSTRTMANTRVVLNQLENSSDFEATTRTNLVATANDSQTLSAGECTPRMTSKRLAGYFKQNKQRRVSYFMGLAKFGLLWAFQADLDLSWGTYGISIIPSLHVQRLAKNTSPGFQLVFKCHADTSNIYQSCDDLSELFQMGVVSPWDIFPDGSTWLERLLRNLFLSPYLVLEFVKVLCKCGAPLRAKTPLLSLVAGWNKRGIHMSLLKELLASGYDCSVDTIYTDQLGPWLGQLIPRPLGFPLFPASCYFPDGNDKGDPFLLEFLRKCSEHAYGVWGQTPLMDLILCGSLGEISKLLRDPRSLRGRNSLGQTPFHAAVRRPDVLSLLLQVYSRFQSVDIDEGDSYGYTPLVYAAAYGCTDAVMLLLKAGANPLRDGHLQYLQRAIFWEHWETVTETIAFLRATALVNEAVLRRELDRLMIEMIELLEYLHAPMSRWRKESLLWPKTLQKMLSFGVDKHLLFQDGSNLLHHSMNKGWMIALFDAGFEYIDRPNSEGETALMTFVSSRKDLAEELLARGCNVNFQNINGKSALEMACAKLSSDLFFFLTMGKTFASPNSPIMKSHSRDLALIANLLLQGADVGSHDNCRCPCAPNGCPPLLRLLKPLGYKLGYLWVLECLLMLDEIQGGTHAQNAMYDLKRLREFESAEMTHVCCNRRFRWNTKVVDDADIDEIIDEEKDFVAILNGIMSDATFSTEIEVIAEGWLTLIADFQIPDRPFESVKYWRSWDPIEGRYTGRVLRDSHHSRGSFHALTNEHWIEEEEDRYWVLEEVTDGRAIPLSSIYSVWVEWVYQNPHHYNYPLPLDRAWYEKRKYWASRQAEVLGGLSD